jgi:hypothetical protein
MDSLQVSDAQAQEVAVAPRVTLKDIEGSIAEQYVGTVGEAVALKNPDTPHSPALDILTVCVLVMKNGFTVIGKSAPASPENFNAELGAKFAYEDAIRQLWPLMGFALRDRLASTSGLQAEAE